MISSTGKDAKHTVLELNHFTNYLNVSLGMTLGSETKALSLKMVKTY